MSLPTITLPGAHEAGDRATVPIHLARGDSLGRYVVLERLGDGGMGIVFAAYDPELDRRIAVKLLKAAPANPTTQGRLLREAQALARLSHPHVVTIHDVGTYDAGTEQGVFLAMELVDGDTLDVWLERVPRSPREILEVFAQAGRGLGAAHRAGLVHRDVKPGNVLVGAEGRVRVTDFGLARPLAVDPRDAPTELPSGKVQHDPGRLDRGSGASAGTPAYMAPEQHEGCADARSDQFGFCVALWEALFGELPYSGDASKGSLDGRLSAIQQGELRVPEDAEVPSRLMPVLRRGLDADPERRYPSMEALLKDLLEDPRARGHRWLLASLLAASLGLTAWGLGQWSGRGEPPCRGADKKIATVWGLQARADLRRRFLDGESRPIRELWPRVERRVERYLDTWRELYLESCQEGLRGELSGGLLDRRMLCLDHELGTLGAWSRALASASRDELHHSVDGIVSLQRSLAACTDTENLLNRSQPPAGVALEDLQSLEAGLAEVRAGLLLGRYAEAIARARPLRDQTRRSDWPSAEAEAELLLGDLLLQTGETEAAAKAYLDAYQRADAGRDRQLRVQSRLGLVWARGLMAGVPGAALEELALARGTVEGLTHEASRRPLQVQLARAEGAAHLLAGDYAASTRAAERAVELARPQGGSEPTPDPMLFHALDTLGEVHFQAGRFEDARDTWLEAREIGRAVYGEGHPNLCALGAALGKVDRQSGKVAEAVAELVRAEATCAQAYGPASEDVASILGSLGLAQLDLGDVAGALASQRRAVTVRESLWGADDPRLAQSLNNLGMTLMKAGAGHREEAHTILLRALAIKERTLGTDHPKLISTLLNLGELLLDSGRPAEARRHLVRADRLARKSVDADHPYRKEARRLLEAIEQREPRLADAKEKNG